MGVPASAKAEGMCYARVFWRMLLEVRSTRADEIGVIQNRLSAVKRPKSPDDVLFMRKIWCIRWGAAAA